MAAGREAIPGWIPELAATYLAHTSAGVPLRELARAKGCHASTVMRQVRKVEAMRDDPLIDEALERLAVDHDAVKATTNAAAEETPRMTKSATRAFATRDDEQPAQRIDREARRILRRLCEKGAFLAVAPTMEKAVVLREVAPGKQNRIAVLDRDVAHAFALREWIVCTRAGKIASYAITPVGRSALRRLLTEERNAKGEAEGFEEAASPFQEQHRYFAERDGAADENGVKRPRLNLAESPLSVLGRKRDKDGVAYLTAGLIEAGERLREDFELAQMGPRVAQNWDRFLTAGGRAESLPARGPAEGPSDARGRVAKALEALGPGLSDIVFRICCFLEGLETAERRLGWSARSGKVVLKIALERLAMHYGIDPSGARRYP